MNIFRIIEKYDEETGLFKEYIAEGTPVECQAIDGGGAVIEA